MTASLRKSSPGRSRWTISRQFPDLFEAPAAFKTYLPHFSYELCDLTQYSEAEIKGEIILQVVLRLLKYSLRSEINDRLDETLALLLQLSEQETAMQYLRLFLRYLSQGSEQLSEAKLQQAVTALFEEGEQLMPTLAQEWIEKGIEKGEAIGLEKGIEKGIEKGEAIGLEKGREEGREAALKVLRRFLAQRFGVAQDHFDPKFQKLDLAAIDRLSEAAFEAQSSADFEARLDELLSSPDDLDEPER